MSEGIALPGDLGVVPMTAEQTYGAHPHGGLSHVHHYREGDAHDHRPTTVPLRRDPRYLREFCAWAEGQYPQGTPGHAAVLAVLKGLRSAVYQAKREGRCLLCGREAT